MECCAHFWQCVLSGAAPGAQGTSTSVPDTLGRVQLPPRAQRRPPLFLRGVALLPPSTFCGHRRVQRRRKDRSRVRDRVLGMRLSRWGNPFVAAIRPAGQLQQGIDAIARAVTAGAKAPRERAYQAASRSEPRHAHRAAGVPRIATAIWRSANYPTDAEARIFYALALAFSADPRIRPIGTSSKPAGCFRSCSRATRSSGLAPTSSTAQTSRRWPARARCGPPLRDCRRRRTPCMPSHTFTCRLLAGIVDAGISRRGGLKAEARGGGELHASDYQVCYLQAGRDRAARAC